MTTTLYLFNTDLEAIHAKASEYKEQFGLEILSKTLIPTDPDEFLEENGCLDMYEVTLQVKCMNAFWALAKHVAGDLIIKAKINQCK